LWLREPRAAREARQAFTRGQYADASKALAIWLIAVPESAEAYLLKGRIAVAEGQLSEAVRDLQRAETLGMTRDELAVAQALIAAKAGRHTDALPTLQRAFAARRTPDRQVDEALAKAYLETYDLTRAGEVLDRWVHDFPDDPKPHLWRAEVHGRTGGDASAVLTDYREALRRDPTQARAHLGLAEELRKAHRTGEAAAEFDTYLAVAPDDATAHLGAGRNLMEHGDEAAATHHLERAIELESKNAEPLKELAEAAARRGDWAATLALLDRAIALDRYDIVLRQRRGLALKGLDRAEEAQAELAEATRLRKDMDRLHDARRRLIASPHDRESQLEVARWMFDHAHDEEGARWAEKILSEHPADPEASRLLAGYHERRGETGLANRHRLHAQPAPQASATGLESPSGKKRDEPSTDPNEKQPKS
jgi:tetratricopeptide (TPR) repeat protein